MNELSEKDNGEPANDFVELIKKFTEKYPCICDLSDDKIDDGVWSDGPLINNAGNDVTTLGVVFSQVENVIPFVIEIANKNGFVVFDGQIDKIFRPDIVEAVKSKPEQKGFWKKLFGK